MVISGASPPHGAPLAIHFPLLPGDQQGRAPGEEGLELVFQGVSVWGLDGTRRAISERTQSCPEPRRIPEGPHKAGLSPSQPSADWRGGEGCCPWDPDQPNDCPTGTLTL
jgi:hypothetical protein